MGVNSTPTPDRIHTGFFGGRNAGKSSMLSAVTGQGLAVVSNVKGTTTDSVYKAMKLLPLGPMMMINTPGIDDEGQLGSLRVRKSYQVLNKTDVAVLVMDTCHGPASEDYALLEEIGKRQILYMTVCNRANLDGTFNQRLEGIPDSVPIPSVSTHTGQGITALKEYLVQLGRTQENSRKIVRDLLLSSNLVVLAIPIDKTTLKGRLILPQQQTIRNILEVDTASAMVRESRLKDTLVSLGKKPRMATTDSQVFTKVSIDMPEDIPLTFFSILFVCYKNSLETMMQDVRVPDNIRKGDRIPISEGYTHHRQCEGIGTVKLSRWIWEYTGAESEFMLTPGTEFPDEPAGYHLIVHYGGCMLNEREMKYRMECAQDQGIPMANYGIVIAYIHGISRQSVKLFLGIAASLDDSQEG